MKIWWIITVLIFVSLVGYSQQEPQKKQQGIEQQKPNDAQSIKKVPTAQQNKTQIQKTQAKKKQIQRTKVQRRKTAQVARKKKAVQRRGKH